MHLTPEQRAKLTPEQLASIEEHNTFCDAMLKESVARAKQLTHEEHAALARREREHEESLKRFKPSKALDAVCGNASTEDKARLFEAVRYWHKHSKEMRAIMVKNNEPEDAIQAILKSQLSGPVQRFCARMPDVGRDKMLALFDTDPDTLGTP